MRIKLISVFLLVASCSPRFKVVLENKENTPLKENKEILVLSEESDIDLSKAVFIGEISGPFEKSISSPNKIMQGCGYSETISEFKKKAKEIGANIIKIYDLKKPSSLNNCYKIKAKLFRNLDTNLTESIQSYNNSRNISKLDKSVDYAIINFYRPKIAVGSVVKYDIYMDDKTLITNMSNGQKISYKISDFRDHIFSAKTKDNPKKEISINIQKGQEYYVRCGIDIGKKHGNPQFSILDNTIGFSEFSDMK
ncbi:hypothetical protein [Algibacter sp. Ld11]|uniref:hypothetical protein n=1 Tax=Algibacter sp. Ld11 TaxID=649150 RepID=UPI003865B937